MYKRQLRGWLKHWDFILLDLISLTISYFLGYTIRHGTTRAMFSNKSYVTMFMIMMIVGLLVIVLMNTMHNVTRRSVWVELRELLKQDVLTFAVITIYLFTVKDSDVYSRATLWLTFILHIPLSLSVRLLWKRQLLRMHKGVRSRAVLLIADREYIRDILDRLNRDPFNEINITAIIAADQDMTGERIDGIPVVSALGDAAKYICREWIDEVYIASQQREVDEVRLRISEMGVTARYEINTAGGGDNQVIEKIAGHYVITSNKKIATPTQMILKRALDIVGGLVGSVLALIVMAIVGPKIKKASPGPILFKQERIGQNGKHITIAKIRSMYLDAEARKAELLKDNRVSDGMMFKLDFDPRVIGNEILPNGTRRTGIGELIRNTSLDEFPQFFSVLKGDMSLVGTRPPTLDEWEKYEYHHRARLSIKPGITGMWQVSGRSNITDFEEVVRLDTEYINNWSLGLDIRILFKTVLSVFKREGAL